MSSYWPDFSNELATFPEDNGEKPILDDVKCLSGNEPITKKLWQCSKLEELNYFFVTCVWVPTELPFLYSIIRSLL